MANQKKSLPWLRMKHIVSTANDLRGRDSWRGSAVESKDHGSLSYLDSFIYICVYIIMYIYIIIYIIMYIYVIMYIYTVYIYIYMYMMYNGSNDEYQAFSPSVVDLGEYDCPIMGQTLLISFQNWIELSSKHQSGLDKHHQHLFGCFGGFKAPKTISAVRSLLHEYGCAISGCEGVHNRPTLLHLHLWG